jgi:hypothetical protein
MADTPPDPGSSDPVPPSSSSFEETNAPPWEEGSDGPVGGDMSPSFALDVARLWVQRHQKASMLGAFGIGVFVGALLRD